MNLSFFIAQRWAVASKGAKPGVMERIAVISVALSLAVMMISLAVMMGFKREISQKIVGFSGDVIITDVRSFQSLNATPIHRSNLLEEWAQSTHAFLSAAPYALKGGIVRTEEAVEGITLKGVDGSYDWSYVQDWLTEGELPRVGDSIRTKDILISRYLARRLEVSTGDRLEMLFVEQGMEPRRDRFRISGIYHSGMEEMDKLFILTDIRNVQRLAAWSEEEISGYEIRTADLSYAQPFAEELNRKIFETESDNVTGILAHSINELYPNIFDWLKAHDVNTAVILVVMLIVAFFNMATALLILVLERTRTIGLLKALGMDNRALRHIFLYRASFVALRGMFWGNLIGLGLILFQRFGHIIPLDPEGYLLSEVPVMLDAWWPIMLNVGFAVAIVALLILPASMVSTIRPAEAVRYE